MDLNSAAGSRLDVGLWVLFSFCKNRKDNHLKQEQKRNVSSPFFFFFKDTKVKKLLK